MEQFANFSQLKVHAYRGDVNGATDFLKNIEQALTLCGLSTCLERWDYRLFDMIGYDTSGLSTQQLDDGFRFMAEFLHPDDAPTLHLCIVNLINTSVAANIMPADFTGIYILQQILM